MTDQSPLSRARSSPCRPLEFVTDGPLPGPEATATPAVRALCAAAGVASVIPLLAWVYGLGAFHFWFLLVTVPGAAVLVWLTVGPRASTATRRIITVGVLAGLLGTLAYDAFRIPFVVWWGYMLLSPIQSYGVLLTDSAASNGWTDLGGWAWHLSNGVGFAIAYVALAEGRPWPWGVAWAMVLESAAVFTPFATAYNIRGQLDVILIAYAAHVPFGLVIGWFGQHTWSAYDGVRAMTRTPNTMLLGIAALVLVGWLQPARGDSLDGATPQATAAIAQGRLYPEFIRVGTGGCVTLANLDSDSYGIAHASTPDRIEAHSVERLCFPSWGVHRLALDGHPFGGGFVIVDRFAWTDQENSS